DAVHPWMESMENTNPAAQVMDDEGYVEIGEGTLIGMGTMVLPNVRIGKRCVIGANSVVTSDIPDYSIAAGSPARVIRTHGHSSAVDTDI
ncbi:MAG: DapH/DapD/GlmU-related protein, partial [Granulicella sp.]